MSVAKVKRTANPLVAGIAAISVAAAVINPAPPPQPPALARVVEAPVALAGIGDPIIGAGFLTSDALFRLGGIVSGLLGGSLLHLPNVIAAQPGALTAYFLRGVINSLASQVGGVLNGQQDIPGALANILDAISYNAQQLAAVEGNIFGGGLLGAAASPQQVSAKAESVQADATALPLPNLGIGQLVGAAGSLTSFTLAGLGGILTPLLGINLHIPGVISDQPYAITQYFLRGIIDSATSEIGGVIDGQQDIPGALAAIVGAISSNAQQLATIESGIFSASGLLGAAASPQQVSAKTLSISATEVKTPDPVSTGPDTPEVKSLVSKATGESTPAATGSATPAPTDVSSTVDKDTPAADKDTTPATDADKTPPADKDKTPAKEPEKTPSDDKDKTPTGTTDKTPADKDKTGSAEKDKTPSADKDKPSAGDKDKSSSSDHDKG